MKWRYIKKLISYVVINIIFALSAWYGVVEGVTWVSNLFVFQVGVFFIFSLISFAVLVLTNNLIESRGMDLTKQKEFVVKFKKGEPLFAVNKNIDLIYDLCLLGLVVSQGWIVCGIVLLISNILQYTSKSYVEKLVKIIRENTDESETQYKASEDVAWDTDIDGNDDLRRMGVLED